jgi:hypothetical protein
VGVGGYFAGVSEGTLFVAWLLSGVLYHVIFGSNLVVRRRAAARETQPQPTAASVLGDTANTSGVYPTLWRQRKRG